MTLATVLVLRLAAQLAGQETVPPKSAREHLEQLGSVLSGTERALAAVRACELELDTAPREALPFLLRVTETPRASEAEQTRRLAALRAEVNALLAELDELESSATPLAPRREAWAETSGLPAVSSFDGQAPERPREPARSSEQAPSSADPLRHGIACFRAGRYDDACRLLAPLDQARAHYWRGRALERLERYDEAIQAMERAVALDGEGFERRRAETDLELLRWKRDFAQNVPGATHAAGPGEGGPR